jgi:hypothetical protein
MMKRIRELAATDNPLMQGILWGILCSMLLVPLLYLHKDELRTLGYKRSEAYFASVFASTVPILIAGNGSSNIITASWRCVQKLSRRGGTSLIDALGHDMATAARTVSQTCSGIDRSAWKKTA